MRDRYKNITTPQVQTYQADLSQSSVTSSLSDFAMNTADVLQQKANHKYELDFRNNAQEQINQIYEKNQTNPSQFQKETKAIKSALAKDAPFHLREDFNAIFDEQTRPYLNKATANYESKLNDEIKFSTLKRMELGKQSASVMAGGLFSGDPVQAADSSKALQSLLMDFIQAVSAVDGRGMPVLSASERFRLTKDFVDDVAFTSVRAGFDEAVNKEDYLRRFESGELKAQIFMDEEGNFIEKPVKDGMARDVFERTRNYMEADINKLKAEADKQNLLDAQLEMMNLVRSDEFVLDPYNKEQRKAVNVDYSKYIEQLGQLPKNEQQQAKVDYVSNVGVLPDLLESELRGSLSNGSPEQRAVAADVIQKISDRKPTALAQFSERERILAQQIVESLDAGVDVERAVEFADKNIYKKDTPEYRARAELFKTDGKKFSEGSFTQWFRNDPNEVPAAMIADYNTLNRKYYMDGGLSAEGADKLAIEKVRANWGVSNIGGKRWMKYAPEVKYNNGQDPEWMDEQLKVETGMSENLILEVAPETIGKTYPDYLVFTKNEYGELTPLRNERGTQQVWRPDYQSSPAYKRLLEENNNNQKDAMIAAKRARNQAIAESKMKSIKEGF